MSPTTPAFAPLVPLFRFRHRSLLSPLPPSARPRVARPARLRAQAKPSEPPPDDSDAHDIPQSAVDWNTEWANFKQSGMKSDAPQGRQPLTSQQRAQRNMQKSMRKFQQAMPTRRQLFADWRFWVALILGLSLFSAFVQSTSTGGAYI